MTVYMVIKVFGGILAFAATPYTLAECNESKNYLTIPPGLDTVIECVESNKPLEFGDFTDEQVEEINNWSNKQKYKKFIGAL